MYYEHFEVFLYRVCRKRRLFARFLHNLLKSHMQTNMKIVCLPTLEDGVPCRQVIKSEKRSAIPNPTTFRNRLRSRKRKVDSSKRNSNTARTPLGVKSTIRLYDAERLMVRLTPKTSSETDTCCVSSLSAERSGILQHPITSKNAAIKAEDQPFGANDENITQPVILQASANGPDKGHHVPVYKNYAPSFANRTQSVENKIHSRWLTKFQHDVQTRKMQEIINHIIQREMRAKAGLKPSESGILQNAQKLLRKLDAVHLTPSRVLKEPSGSKTLKAVHDPQEIINTTSDPELLEHSIGCLENVERSRSETIIMESCSYESCSNETKQCDDVLPTASSKSGSNMVQKTDHLSYGKESEEVFLDENDDSFMQSNFPLPKYSSLPDRSILKVTNQKHLIDTYLADALQPAYKKRISVDSTKKTTTLFNAKLAKKDSLVVQYKSFIKSRDRARLQEIQGQSDEFTYVAPNRAPSIRLLIPRLSIDGKVTPLMWERKGSRAKTIDEMVKEALDSNRDYKETVSPVWMEEEPSLDTMPSVILEPMADTTAHSEPAEVNAADENPKDSCMVNDTVPTEDGYKSQLYVQTNRPPSISQSTVALRSGFESSGPATSKMATVSQSHPAAPLPVAKTPETLSAPVALLTNNPDRDNASSTYTKQLTDAHPVESAGFPFPPDNRPLSSEHLETSSKNAFDGPTINLQENSPEEITLEVQQVPRFLQPENDDYISEEEFFFQRKHGVRFVLPGIHDIHTYQPVVLEGSAGLLRASNDMELIATVERNIQETKELSNHLDSIIQKYGTDPYSMFSPTLGREGQKLAKTLSPKSLTKKIKHFIKRKQTAAQLITSPRDARFDGRMSPEGIPISFVHHLKNHQHIRHNALADTEDSWLAPLDRGLFGEMFKMHKDKVEETKSTMSERNRMRKKRKMNVKYPLPQNRFS